LWGAKQQVAFFMVLILYPNATAVRSMSNRLPSGSPDQEPIQKDLQIIVLYCIPYFLVLTTKINP
jgi:hypothetical protein